MILFLDSTRPSASLLFSKKNDDKDGWGDDDDADWSALDADPKTTDKNAGGWDDDDDEWASFDDPKPMKVASGMDRAKQRDERRQKQKEAKERRALEAGKKSRPLKLGGVKKVD